MKTDFPSAKPRNVTEGLEEKRVQVPGGKEVAKGGTGGGKLEEVEDGKS